MSSSGAPSKPQLSKHRANFVRSKAKKSNAKDKKDHSFDATNYHQNANRREIRSLVKFDCPVCKCKNTAVVHFESKRMVAIVKCGVCMSLQPPPEDLPYPYETSYIPRLENKADVFFRFQDAFERIAKQGNSRGGGGMSEGGGLVPPGQQQQPGGKHDDDDEEDDDEEEMEEMQQGSGEHLLDGLGLDFTALAAGRGNERRSGPDGDAGDDDADEEIDDEEEEEEEQE